MTHRLKRAPSTVPYETHDALRSAMDAPTGPAARDAARTLRRLASLKEHGSALAAQYLSVAELCEFEADAISRVCSSRRTA
jgi:hypothetical protein